MTQQIYNFKSLESTYKKITTDKAKKSLKTLEFILEINKSVGFDEILVREGYQSYSLKNQLESKRSFQTNESFFNYIRENLDSIQSNYLRDSTEAKLIDEALNNNQQEYNFLLNRSNVSKFIRDEATHYQKTLDKFLEAQTEEDEQRGIKSSNIHLFIIDLFKNQYISVICDNKPYLEKPVSAIKTDIAYSIEEYALAVKDLTQQQAKSSFFISEQEILDYLTFWLKRQSRSHLFVLYARTRHRLQQDSKFISNQSHLKSKMHPSRMTVQELVKKQIEIEQVKQENHEQKVEKVTLDKQDPTINYQAISKQKEPQKKILINEKAKEVVQVQPVQQAERINKQALLANQMKGLFEFGCKRRIKLNKNSTFEDIEQQSNTMDLQKFTNFCVFFQLTSIITKELITEYFKMHALNLRVLDYPRFEKVVNKMVKIDCRIVDNLLKRLKFEVKGKKEHIRKDKKIEGKLSDYKFMLYPINGKDISSIEKELHFKRLERQVIRQEKQKKAYSKRQQIERPKFKLAKRINSGLKISTINAFQMQSIRDSSFNPEKLIELNDNDRLWDAYEAKIWNKEQSSRSALQNILSKRMEKGASVLKKFNSQSSFLYD